MNPQEIVKWLIKLSHLLDAATKEIEQLDDEAVRAKARHQVAHAGAYLNTTGTVDVRKSETVLAVQNEYLDMEIAECKVRACKERIRTLRDQLDVGRSLNAASRAEWAASGVGGQT